jgi:hypothetical protein
MEAAMRSRMTAALAGVMTLFAGHAEAADGASTIAKAARQYPSWIPWKFRHRSSLLLRMISSENRHPLFRIMP